MMHLTVLIDLQKQDHRSHLMCGFQCQLTQDHWIGFALSMRLCNSNICGFILSLKHCSLWLYLVCLRHFHCNITQKTFRMANQDGWVPVHNIPKEIFWNCMQNLSPRLSWALIQILVFMDIFRSDMPTQRWWRTSVLRYLQTPVLLCW